MITIYVDHSGGTQLPTTFLKKFFPGVVRIKKEDKNKLGFLTIDNMSFFTKNVEKNQN